MNKNIIVALSAIVIVGLFVILIDSEEEIRTPNIVKKEEVIASSSTKSVDISYKSSVSSSLKEEISQSSSSIEKEAKYRVFITDESGVEIKANSGLAVNISYHHDNNKKDVLYIPQEYIGKSITFNAYDGDTPIITHKLDFLQSVNDGTDVLSVKLDLKNIGRGSSFDITKKESERPALPAQKGDLPNFGD